MTFNTTIKVLFYSAFLSVLLSCNNATSEPEASQPGAGKAADTPVQENRSAIEATESATSVSVPAAVDQAIRSTLAKQLGPVPIDKIRVSELPGFYEVIASGQILYISKDQSFLFPGPLLKIEQEKLINLSQNSLRRLEMEKAPERAALMASVAEEDMVVFRAPEEKYVVDVFTDVDCAYCRRLHQNMDGYLSRGITIRYLAFPRAGVGSGAYNKLVSVWCAKDRQSAMNDAKLHNKFDIKDCDNPVADQYAMTRQLGLTGTPALILSDGELISGFMEPAKLEEYLKQRDSHG
jgi:thiol:disulfide interchange protein DsbC